MGSENFKICVTTFVNDPLPKALAMATFSRIPRRGMRATADPSSDIIPPNDVTFPVTVSFRLNGGGWKGGRPENKNKI